MSSDINTLVKEFDLMLRKRAEEHRQCLAQAQRDYIKQSKAGTNDSWLAQIEAEIKDLNTKILEVEVIIGRFSKVANN